MKAAESSRASQSPVRASIRHALASLLHWSLLAVAVLAAGFTYLALVIEGRRDLATPVFAISGTLVALILPAASLSAQYIEQRVNFWAERWARQEPDGSDVNAGGRDAMAAIESVVSPMWRGFAFALISLPLAAAALFRPNIEVASISAEAVLIGASMGFVLVAVFSFLPFIWTTTQLDLAREARARMFTEATPPTPSRSSTPEGAQITRNPHRSPIRRARSKRPTSDSTGESAPAAVRPLRLHEAIIQVLERARGPLTAREIADRIREDGLYLPPRSGQELSAGQVSARVGNRTYRDRFVRQDGRISLADRPQQSG